MAVFTAEQEKIIETNSDPVTFSFFRALILKEYTPSAALSEGTMIQLKSLLYALSASNVARSITFPDWHDNLAIKLRKFSDAWVDPATLLGTSMPHLPLLLEKVVSGASYLDIWATIVKHLNDFDNQAISPTEDSVGTTIAAVDDDIVESLKNDWTSTFIPDSLEVLEDTIYDFDEKLKKDDKFYARTLVFIQSSGMGKSRLADAFGESCPMINYVLREERTHGYPPADPEILSLMRMEPSDSQNEILTSSPGKSSKKYPKSRADATWYHSLAVGLLQASFENLIRLVKRSSGMTREGLADLMHKEMAHNSGSRLDHRSQSRIEFCRSVAKRAKEIASDLVKDPSWRGVFDNDKEGPAIRLKLINKKKNHLKGLLDIVQTLLNLLNRFEPRNAHHPPLVVIFDEASSLLKTEKSGKIHSGRYIALNRIMSCLKEFPIWFFIISTESMVGTILPLYNAQPTGDYAEDPSLRFYDESRTPLKRIPPFLALLLDIQDRSTMQDPTRRQNELNKSLSDFGEPKHMAMFGRRLWVAYSDDPKRMYKVAKLKLVGGAQQELYKSHEVDHVFAALSFRLSLDPCMHNSKALPLIGTAVNSHMRVVISIDEETGTMHTITPSEPIVAKAAMEYLCDGFNWPLSITTLVRGLFDKGLVEKGLKGELYARLLLVLAHDWVRCRQWRVSLNQEPSRKRESISSRTSSPESNPKFMKSFTVKDFLKALYVEDCHKSINAVDRQILGARMNFTHFVPTCEHLSPQVLPDLLSDLLRRSAALQLAPNQPTYDILLPIYFGRENEPLDPSKCGCVMIQVKNKNRPSTPKTIFKEEFTMVSASGSSTSRKKVEAPTPEAPTPGEAEAPTLGEAEASASNKAKAPPVRDGPYFVFDGMTNPILLLLFDLGITPATASRVRVSYSSNGEKSPRVWAIRSRGHDETVFGCLKLMHCEDSSKSFFTSTMSGVSEHDILARRNQTFSKLSRDFRYPPMKNKGDALMEDEGDTLMEDEGDALMEDEGDVLMED